MVPRRLSSVHTNDAEPFSAVEGGSCHICRNGDAHMAETERTRRLREAESRLLELRRYL
jgi:hypothetical protein